jgi:hypothetical protein
VVLRSQDGIDDLHDEALLGARQVLDTLHPLLQLRRRVTLFGRCGGPLSEQLSKHTLSVRARVPITRIGQVMTRRWCWK